MNVYFFVSLTNDYFLVPVQRKFNVYLPIIYGKLIVLQKRAIEMNIQFLAEDFIPSCEVLYEKYFGMPSMRLKRMRNELKT